ncbi:hypothetical protein BDW_09925 [Bdellovibrio bacteriovorus W]|nr:hypothetical protein BDW_09925 [Bdellovibrio bacteriovorus W]
MRSAKYAFVFLLLFAVSGEAQVRMSEIEIFNRCYNRFVKKPLPVSGNSKGFVLGDAVRKGQKKGAQACSELLAYADFNSSGVLANKDADEARRVIETFHGLHISFFSTPAMTTFTNLANMTILLKDIDEPALYFTQALFANKDPSTVLTANRSLRSVRESNYVADSNYATRSIATFHSASYPAAFDPRGLLVWDHNTATRDARRASDLIYIRDVAYKNQLIEAGDDAAKKNEVTNAINGAANTTRNLMTQNIDDNRFIGHGALLGVAVQEPLMAPIQPIRTSIAANGQTAAITANYQNHDLHWHMGGGVLGSQMYMLKTTNLGVNSIIGNTSANDPYTNSPRRFTSKIFEDLLCHTLPTLTEADVRADVDAKSAHGFKQAASCMRCHSTFDPINGVYRNILVGQTGNPLNNEARFKPARERGSPILTLVKMESTTKNIYALQTPNAPLRFRDHTNNYVNTTVNSVAELGSTLAKNGDFYRCVAKRYYHFLTGVNVNLTSSDSDISVTAKKHKDFVYLLGRVLQGSLTGSEKTSYQSKQKSLKGMIDLIINSETFSRRDLGTLED